MKVHNELCCKELGETINVKDGDIYDSCPLPEWDDYFIIVDSEKE